MKRSPTTLPQSHDHSTSEPDRPQGGSGRFLRALWLALATFVMAAIVSGPVFANVQLRVDARPITDPINVFVTVTNGDGNPVGNLTDEDFVVLVDGEPVPLTAENFALSPIDDDLRRVSIIFVMDYSGSVSDVQVVVEDSVVEFLNTMQLGDWAGIIKFNDTLGAQIIPPEFLEIEDAATRQALINAVGFDYTGTGSPVYAALKLAVEQFESASTLSGLPEGPKAIVLVSDGRNNDPSVTGPEVVTLANDEQLSIFTVAVGNINFAAMTELPFQTGGQFYEAQDGQAVADAYTAISTLLQNEYVLTFASGITDCDVHTVEVQVTDQAPATSTFTRCTAPGTSTPPPEGDVGGTPPPPPASDDTSSGGGGGGGGAFGPLGLIAGLSLLALRRRLRAA
jgi:Ca-activated chloride channel homolog